MSLYSYIIIPIVTTHNKACMVDAPHTLRLIIKILFNKEKHINVDGSEAFC